MQTRAITGFFFVLIMVGSVLLGPHLYAAFFLLLSLLSLYEFYSIFRKKKIAINLFNGLLLGFVLFAVVIAHTLYAIPLSTLWLVSPLVSLLFITELYRKTAQPFMTIGLSLLGILYVICPYICFFLLGFVSGNFDWSIPLGFLIMLWASDTGAYLAGKFLGKHKLFERHSPKKTWEGALGGLLTSLVSAYIMAQYWDGLALWQWLVSSSLIVVFGIYGDLVESMLKRSYQMKDSGNILPGHGGLLDRFDGLLLAAPIVYLFLLWSQML